MYNSIPHNDGLLACKDALKKHSKYSNHQIKLILELISLVLTNNCFSFLDRYFCQIRGTAMGSPFAPAYANIFMNYLWRNKIAPSLPMPLWLKRFLDDIITIFLASIDTGELLQILNSAHETTKFTISERSPSQPYLDCKLSIEDGKVQSELFSKPTDSHRYLPPSSCHPGHIFRSIVYSGALRIRRICSRDDPFIFHLMNFRGHLRASGYSSKFIDPILEKVSSLNRSTLLTSKQREGVSDRVLMVTTFDPRMPDFQKIHSKHKHIIEASAPLKAILPSQPLVALRRPANLGNLVVKTLPPSPPTSDLPFGHHPCEDKRCLICKDGHRVNSHRVISAKTGESFPLKHHLKCSSSNVIYSLTCSKCPDFQYVGKTITSLRQRFNFHKSCVRGSVGLNPKTQQPYEVDLHFRQPDHSISHMRIQAVEQCTPASIAKNESRWMHLLKSHRVVGGPNIDEPYIRGLLRSLSI